MRFRSFFSTLSQGSRVFNHQTLNFHVSIPIHIMLIKKILVCNYLSPQCLTVFPELWGQSLQVPPESVHCSKGRVGLPWQPLGMVKGKEGASR